MLLVRPPCLKLGIPLPFDSIIPLSDQLIGSIGRIFKSLKVILLGSFLITFKLIDLFLPCLVTLGNTLSLSLFNEGRMHCLGKPLLVFYFLELIDHAVLEELFGCFVSELGLMSLVALLAQTAHVLMVSVASDLLDLFAYSSLVFVPLSEGGEILLGVEVPLMPDGFQSLLLLQLNFGKRCQSFLHGFDLNLF